MNLRLGLLLSLLMSVGCQLKPSEHSEFYTWVDESGQLRTERIDEAGSAKSISNTAEAGATDSAANQASSQTSSQNAQAFDPSDFTSSDDVDARLRDARLFAWQDETGKQSVTQLEKPEQKPENDEQGVGLSMPQTAKRRFGSDCCNKLAGFERFLWSDLAGRELKLNTYYAFEKSLNSDALMLDLADFEGGQIRLKTFIRKGKMALPDVLLLNERFQLVDVLATPFTHFVEESWASYGYMQGIIRADQLEKIEHIVLIPSEQIGVLELGQQTAKITNLGSILVQRDAPAP